MLCSFDKLLWPILNSKTKTAISLTNICQTVPKKVKKFIRAMLIIERERERREGEGRG